MAIPMQGSWTVSVKSKNADFPQRFVIEGADSGNGTYAGVVTTAPFLVTGANWRIQIQNNPGSGFVDSADQIKFPTVSGGNYRVDIQSDDAGGDGDFNDLVLTCSTPVTQTDFIVYGSATSYTGRCFFPCWPGWLVIDSVATLREALRYSAIRKAIRLIYPERVIIKPIPQPDPPPFIPMLIPLVGDQLIPEKRAQILRLPSEVQTEAADEAPEQTLSLRSVALKSSASRFVSEFDRVSIATIVDQVAFFCHTEKLAGYAIRFEEYDRTAAELSGGPYTGTGARESLGVGFTDRNGNYVYRFTRSISDFIQETNVDVSPSEDEVVQSMPDVIVKLLDAMAPAGVAFESAPHWNVPVLKRIDLCFRRPARMGCQGGPIIQALGAIRRGLAATVFDPDGRITCTDTSLPDVPQAQCAAWFDKVRLFGCFTGMPVRFYTIRHRRKTSSGFDGWEFYQEPMSASRVGVPVPVQFGPFDEDLEVVNGSPKVTVKAYRNIERETGWAESDIPLKAVITTYGGTPPYAPTPGTVEFQIQGYDDAGNFLVGATDTITMYIDNTGVDVHLASVEMGTQTGGDCALFHLSGEPDPARLKVRFKAVQRQGFLRSYALTVRKGNIGGFDIVSTTGPSGEASGKLGDSYTHGTTGTCNQLFGTMLIDEPEADATDHVTAYIIPRTGNWLETGQPFCTFSVNIGGTMRRTNGFNSAEDGFGPDQYLLGIEA